jgi:serine/threonine protein kinase
MFHEGQQIGHYTLIKQLGIGGFGEVWLAHNQTDASSSPVAIKFPKSEDVDWQAIVQEIGLWVLCGKHSNVLPLIEARNYNGQIAIISEYAPDGSLRDLLKKQGALSIKQAVEMIIGVLDGLAHLHSSGIIHRDLKPENILLQGNAPRLADFGISRVITVNSYSNTIIGTPSYMSPESFNGKRTVQTDVWGMGVILYELVEGKLPFPQKTYQELHEAISTCQPEPLSQSIPPKLQGIVLKALAKQPEARHQTSAEMRQALHDYWQALCEQETISTIEQTIQFTESEITIESLRLIPYRKGDKWGFCDSNKNIVIEVKYDFADSFREGLARVSLNDKCGHIDKTGRETTPIMYDLVNSFSEGLAGVKLNDKCGFIDKTGREIIPIKYDDVESFSEGLARVSLNKKWGYIDKTGREITHIKYDGADSFNESLAHVKLNDKYGYIDKTGREIIPIKYDNTYSFSEGLAGVTLNGKSGFVDKAGREIIPIKYDIVDSYNKGSFSEGLAVVKLNNKRGYIDKTGREVIPIKYAIAFSFSEGLAYVAEIGKSGYIDKTGREIIPIKIKYGIGTSFSEGLACVSLNKKWGFIDKTGREITPIKYDFANAFKEGLALVELNDKYGFVDKAGREITPIKYDVVDSFSEGLAVVYLNDKLGYIGRDGTEYFED